MEELLQNIAITYSSFSRQYLDRPLSGEYILRPIRKEDNATMARIIRTVMSEYSCVGEGYSIQDPEVDFLSEVFTGDKSFYWVVEKDGEVLGGAGIGPLKGASKEFCELKKMYFSIQLRGKGLGKKLAAILLEKAKAAGFQFCYLETVERLSTANLLYQKMGFERLSAPIGDTGHGSCEFQYVKTL
jgi:putative acetyltransferase